MVNGQTVDAKASCLVAWRVDFSISSPDAASDLELGLKFACQVLEARLLAVLRTGRSDVYNVNVVFARSSLSDYGMINIGEPADAQDKNKRAHSEPLVSKRLARTLIIAKSLTALACSIH